MAARSAASSFGVSAFAFSSSASCAVAAATRTPRVGFERISPSSTAVANSARTGAMKSRFEQSFSDEVDTADFDTRQTPPDFRYSKLRVSPSVIEKDDRSFGDEFVRDDQCRVARPAGAERRTIDDHELRLRRVDHLAKLPKRGQLVATDFAVTDTQVPNRCNNNACEVG